MRKRFIPVCNTPKILLMSIYPVNDVKKSTSTFCDAVCDIVYVSPVATLGVWVMRGQKKM